MCADLYSVLTHIYRKGWICYLFCLLNNNTTKFSRRNKYEREVRTS